MEKEIIEALLAENEALKQQIAQLNATNAEMKG